jgi:hypothetical protein
MTQLLPPLAYQTDLFARECAHYIREARSWLPHSHNSPDCARVPDDVVLKLYLERLGWIHAADGIDLHCFWEKALELSGFESSRQQPARTWNELCKNRPVAAATAAVAATADTSPAGLRRDFWKPEEWEGTPTENFMKGITREEYEAAHPLLYPPKK